MNYRGCEIFAARLPGTRRQKFLVDSTKYDCDGLIPQNTEEEAVKLVNSLLNGHDLSVLRYFGTLSAGKRFMERNDHLDLVQDGHYVRFRS